MKIVVPAIKAVALVWYFNVVTQQNIRLGGTQLLTPLNMVFSILVFGLLVLYDFLKDVFFPAFWEVVDGDGKISRERLRQHMVDQNCGDITEVQQLMPSVYQDLQDYNKNHRLKKDEAPHPLPVLDPKILRNLEDASENKHRVLCETANSMRDGEELELFGHQKPKGIIANWFFKPNPKEIRARRRAARRKRVVTRRLGTCLFIRAWVRSVLSPESLRVELDEDGEMYVDPATSAMVDNKLREFFKLHCWNLQSQAEYHDLAKVIVFYTNEELGIAELLEPRRGKPQTK